MAAVAKVTAEGKQALPLVRLVAMALQSPAPLLEELSSSLRHLETTLDPLLARKLTMLTQKLESGSSIASSQAAKAAASGEDSEAKSKNEANIELSGKLDSARLNASVAYVLLDLIWSESTRCSVQGFSLRKDFSLCLVYLKVKGIDPTTHPVMAELVRQRFQDGIPADVMLTHHFSSTESCQGVFPQDQGCARDG